MRGSRRLTRGAKDFVTKPFDMIEVLLRVRNLLESRMLFQDLRKQNRTLLESASGRTRELESTRIEIIERLALAAEYRDDETSEHNRRVGDAVGAAGGSDRAGPPKMPACCAAPPALHDIGKIGIPDALLRKPGALTDSEVRVMRTHAAIGARILGGSHIPLLAARRNRGDLASRTLGRHRLSARAQGQRHSVGRPHRRRGRCVRRDHQRPPLSRRASGARRDAGAARANTTGTTRRLIDALERIVSADRVSS